MHHTVRQLGNPPSTSARSSPAGARNQTLTWVNCGHPHAYLADTNGTLTERPSPPHPALGVGDDETAFTPTQRELRSGERVILVTDGITQRRTEGGGTFGVDGIRQALAAVENPTAAATAMAVLQAGHKTTAPSPSGRSPSQPPACHGHPQKRHSPP